MNVPVCTITWPRLPCQLSLDAALVLLLAAASAVNGAIVYVYL